MSKNNTDFKQTLWKTADSLRAQMDAAEYKHIVLGLIFLKYISDSFSEQKERIKEMVTDPKSDFFISEDLNDIEKSNSLNLNSAENAFYDALSNNKSAEELMGEEVLVQISREIAEKLRKNVTVDWSVRESVRARLRLLVKNLLRKYKYPPDQQEEATELVLSQAEVISEELVA